MLCQTEESRKIFEYESWGGGGGDGGSGAKSIYRIDLANSISK